MITNVEFLVKMLDKKQNPQKGWDNFIQESKTIWYENKKWKYIKENIITLQKGILNGQY